jgi:molybdate transport system substrate-binding protein
MRPLCRSLVFLGLLAVAVNLRAEEPVRVFAAASLTNALGDIAAQWQKAGHPAPSLAFGASSTLAKQIDAGAPADLIASADQSWMDYLGNRERIVSASRVDLLGNELVLIVPKDHRFSVTMAANFDLGRSFSGKLCTGEPGVVPVGNYAKQGLEYFGWWAALAGRIVGTDDVRTALVFVERGECPLGIVYATDAAISDKVEILARFPPESHKPIVYPLALVRDARPGAQAFLDFLKGSPEAAAIFQHYGFSRLTH